MHATTLLVPNAELPLSGSYYGVDERIELWGLQIPHNSARPQLEEVDPADAEKAAEKAAKDVITWTSVDRLNMSIGLLYALSNLATDQGIRLEGVMGGPRGDSH